MQVLPTHDVQRINDAADALKFLSDRNRLRLLTILMRKESCVCDLIDQLDLPQTLISYHLAKLRNAGLVQTRRSAQWIYYSLDAPAFAALTAPIGEVFGIRGQVFELALPSEAGLGTSEHCDSMPPDPDKGAVER